MIFLALRGFSLTEIALLESIFHISSLIFEVPSGAIADIFGRKYCRISGRFLFIISLFIMYYAGTFILQAVGFMLTAFSYNLESGAGEAFVYDSMKLDGNESKYIHTAGRIELFYQLATIISFFVGGFLATGPGYIYVFYLSALFSLAALITGLGFREPEITEHKEQEHGSMFKVLRDSAVILKSRPKIIYLIVFTETIFVFSTSLFFYLQNFLKISGRTEFYIGTFYSISAVFAAVSAFYGGRIEARIGEKNVMRYLPLLLVFIMWGVFLTDYKEYFFVLTGLIEGILIVAVSNYINRLIPSQLRATILSVQSMYFSFLMIILFPLLGYIAESFSFQTIFLLMALLTSGLTLAYYLAVVYGSRFVNRDDTASAADENAN